MADTAHQNAGNGGVRVVSLGGGNANGHITGDANPLATDPSDGGTSQTLPLVPEVHRIQAKVNDNHTDSQQSGQSEKVDRFDPNFTQNVINATGPEASPRMRQVIASLIKHIHDFARENEITVDEWMAGVDMVSPYDCIVA